MSRRKKSRRIHLLLRVGLLSALLSACLLDWYFVRQGKSVVVSQAMVNSKPASDALAHSLVDLEESFPPATQSAKPLRIVYPYSVIPGGVRSMEDLRIAIAKDPVVSAHYAAFRLERARIVQSAQDRSVHVSYRLGNRIYWSKNALKIPKGESLITDGVRTARTRCGNQIAESIMAPVSPLEPPPDELNEPNGTDIGSAFHPAEPPAPPVPGPTVPINPPLWFPVPAPPPVVKVPEPGTGFQLLAALPVLWFLRRWKWIGEPYSGN